MYFFLVKLFTNCKEGVPLNSSRRSDNAWFHPGGTWDFPELGKLFIFGLPVCSPVQSFLAAGLGGFEIGIDVVDGWV